MVGKTTMPERTIKFEYSRSTRTTFVYEEIMEGGRPPFIGRLYLKQWALGEAPPKVFVATLRPEGEEAASL